MAQNPGLDMKSHNSTNQFQSMNFNAPGLISEECIEEDSIPIDYFEP